MTNPSAAQEPERPKLDPIAGAFSPRDTPKSAPASMPPEASKPAADMSAYLSTQLDDARSQIEGLEVRLEAALVQNRLELVPTSVLRDREGRERDLHERVATAEAHWYAVSAELALERHRLSQLDAELGAVRAVFTARQRKKLGSAAVSPSAPNDQPSA